MSFLINDIKTAALKLIPKLPNFVNLRLMMINTNPNLVYGRRYRDYKKFLSQQEGCGDQEFRLIESVNHSLKEIPYYHKIYGDLQIHSVEEFEDKIQFIDKDEILNNFDNFICPRIDMKDFESGTTGGTSGKPLQLIAPKDRYVVEMATMHTLWSRAGYKFDIRGVIRNHRLNGKDYIINPITREVIFDGFRLDDDYFRVVYRALKSFGISYIHCYPSTAYEFALFLLRYKLDVSFIKAFLSGSENIFEYQRDLIQNALGVRFYNWYGHSEKLVLAGYCKNTNYYHIEPAYGYFELVDESGNVIKTPGQTGEIVGTSFHNHGMPFVRYRTGDFADYIGSYCSACNRQVPIIGNIKGRWSGDKIYNSDGTFITTTALNLHSSLYKVINGLQYIQKEKGLLEVLVIKSSDYRQHHEKALYDHFRSKLKKGTTVNVLYVDRLERLPNGKFVHLISSIPPDNLACPIVN